MDPPTSLTAAVGKYVKRVSRPTGLMTSPKEFWNGEEIGDRRYKQARSNKI